MKKSYYCFIFLLFIYSTLFCQVYQIGHTTITFVDVSRNNRNIPTEIYYPADSNGDNVAMTTQNTLQFPSLVFGHGFVMTWDAYQNFWSSLVPNGYIMAFPKTEGSLSPSHLEFGKDLAFVINAINSLGSQSSSLFYNRVSSFNAVMGHSMGGGASFLAVPLNLNIKTIVNFAPAETNPSAISAASSVSIPTLIFSGANDCVTPSNTNQLPMYNAVSSLCKTYISIIGGNHCQMAQSNAFCNFGEATCSPSATITRSVQHAKIFGYLLPWLDYQLKGICTQGTLFDTQIAIDTSIIYLKNCIQCSPLELDENFKFESNEIIVFPNPAKDFIEIKGLELKVYDVKLFDVNSKIVFKSKFTEKLKLDVSGFTSGVYYYVINDGSDKKEKGKFIKK